MTEREREISRTINEVLYEVDEMTPHEDVLDALYQVLGPLSETEDAFAMKRLRTIR